MFVIVMSPSSSAPIELAARHFRDVGDRAVELEQSHLGIDGIDLRHRFTGMQLAENGSAERLQSNLAINRSELVDRQDETSVADFELGVAAKLLTCLAEGLLKLAVGEVDHLRHRHRRLRAVGDRPVIFRQRSEPVDAAQKRAIDLVRSKESGKPA